LYVWLLLLSLLLLTACGTLEVGVETTIPPGEAAATPTAVATLDAGATPAPDPVPMPTPIPASTELRVAFVNVTEHGNNVWLWTEGEQEAVALTKDGGVGDVKLSDDGEIVAFTRGDGLWMVRSDGADDGHLVEERELVSSEDFAAMEPREPFEFEVLLSRFEWVPGTHILAFNTRLRTEIGLILNDDLYLVNADTLERTALLPPGEGGEFYYSPDGGQVAIVTSGSISLIDADGSDRREVFTYTPVATYSEVQFYAQPVWAADSSALRVAIPPVDSNMHPPPPASVWHIRTDGTPASMIASVAVGQRDLPALSPDLGYVAHLHDGQSDSTSVPIVSLLVTDLENRETVMYYPEAGSGTPVTLDSGETITEYPAVTSFYGWAPDSQHFAFLAYPGSELPPQAQIGQLGGGTAPLYSDADAVIDVRWVDADRYLFLAQGGRGWGIMLGEVDGPVKSVAGVVGSPPAYDFAAPPPALTTSTSAVGDSGDTPVPFGLIYQTGDGLWHVNVDGEPVWILDRPGAVVSPDSTRALYGDGDDLWLVDVATGERRNLTQTVDRSECCAQWWPGQPDVVLFNSWPPGNEGPNYGFPTVARLDGSDYRVLDEDQVSYALPAPSPDGQTVAYDRAGQGWLYRADTGPEPFDLTPYGLSSDPELRVVSPAWSPDGQRLAWLIGDCRAEGCQYSVGVFDLEAQAAQFLHPYNPVGRGGQPPAPVWSPDGRWLAFAAAAVDADDAGLWVVRADGQRAEEYRLDTGLGRVDPNPIWSPDGRWLVFGSTPQGVGSGLWLAEVGTWGLQPLDLPADAYLVAWVNSPGS
jgi:hypothetical protein